jgi:hypothetical protein
MFCLNFGAKIRGEGVNMKLRGKKVNLKAYQFEDVPI